MPVFKYQGTSFSGQPVSGVVEAFDEFDALEKAKASCRIVSKIETVKERSNFLKMEVGSGKIKPKLIAIMCSQFCTILTSGMSIGRCVALVADQTSDKGLKAILTEVAEDVGAGHSLATSFENKGGAKLPTLFYETIRAGEHAGSLDKSFETLHKYFDKRSKTKAKVAQALTYPIFVIVLAIVVVAVVMVLVIPRFTEILTGYGADLPVMTQVLIDASDFMAANILWIVLVIAAVALVVKLWISKTEQGRVAWANCKIKAPIIGNVSLYSNTAQIANTLSTLLSSGLQMTKAVDVTAKVVDNYVMAKGVANMTPRLEEGKRLGACMQDVPFLPHALVEMVSVGEETGSLEETLATMGEFYDEETDRVTQKALSRLEPAILIFIAVFAGYIVIALYLAMFSIYSAM